MNQHMKALKALISHTITATQRFPVPVLCSLLFCIIAIGDFFEDEMTARHLFILFCGCFWFIALKLFAESCHWKLARYYAVGVAVFAAISWHLYTSPYVSIPFMFLGTGLFLSMCIAPFLRNDATSNQIWAFNYGLWFHIAFTILAAIILYLGLISIVASLEALFGIDFYRNVYGDIWLVVATFFSPVLAMGGIPKRFDITEDSLPKASCVILSYIVLPLLLAYALILYAYTGKILLTWELPKGGVAYMVSAFGSIGVITYLASYPIHQTYKLAGFFSRHFFKILLVPLALLAVAISVRIEEYGITEKRYAIVLCLIWLGVICLMALAKHKDLPKCIFVTVIALLIAASFGPWGAVNISAWSQLSRLQALLEKNNVLVNGQIQIPGHKLNFDDRSTISSITDYFVDTKKADRMKPWFAGMPKAHIHKEDKNSNAETILKDMGLAYVDRYSRSASTSSERFDFRTHWEHERPAVTITGYDYLVNSKEYYSINQPNWNKKITLNEGKQAVTLSITYDPKENVYIITAENTGETIRFSLTNAIDHLRTEVTETNNRNILKREPVIIDGSSKRFAMRLIIYQLTGNYNQDTQKTTVTHIGSTLLVKRR